MSELNVKETPQHWKKWIATNLIRGCSHASIAKVLKENGFNDAEIYLELKIVENNPYIQAGIEATKDLDIQLRKRNWLLSTYDSLAQLDSGYSQNIDTIDTPAFSEFIQNYYSKHKPVLLKNGINHWKALETWTPQHFADKYGDRIVQIQSNRSSDPNFEVESPKFRKDVSMADFVNMMSTTDDSNDFYITGNNTQKNRNIMRDAFQDLGDFGEGYRQLTDDPTHNTYFWMGPKGIFTPLHHDLTNNMLVQIYGKKKVTLIPAAQVQWLYNNRHVFCDVDFPKNVNYEQFPDMKHVTPFEILIEPGDALFIPIGWWHCVDGLSEVISISFTNFNAPNDFYDAYHAITST